MKRPVKIGLIVVAAVAVLLVAGVAVVLVRIDSIVESTVEKEGTAQLDLATALADADVSLFGGSLTLDGLTIANPEGYTAPHLFEMGQVNVGVSYGDLTSEPVRVKSIDINSPKLVIERGSGGLQEALQLNLRELLENLEMDPNAETTKLVIDRLTVTSANVVVRPNIEGLEESYEVTIPDVTLDNIGTGEGAENGAAIGKVAADVAMALAKAAIESEELPPELRGLLAGDVQAILSQYGDKLKTELNQRLQEELGELKGQLGDEAGAVLDDVLEGDTEGAIDEGRKTLEEKGNEALQKGLNDLLGGNE